MTKYICECFDGARKCTHETPGFLAPTLCCVRANATCHWLKVEDHHQEVETPAPIIPEWCREGAWVYVTPDNRAPFYGKVFSLGCSGVMVTLDGKTMIGVFSFDKIKKARIRQWNDDEMESKVGKVFEDSSNNLTLCYRYHREDKTLDFIGRTMTAGEFITSDWSIDGLPCGVIEHQNYLGGWVE